MVGDSLPSKTKNENYYQQRKAAFPVWAHSLTRKPVFCLDEKYLIFLATSCAKNLANFERDGNENSKY